MLEHHKLNYGQTQIPYTLEFKDRTTLAIEVHPDATVHVKAPLNTDLNNIEAKLLKRANWISKEQQKFKSYAPKLNKRSYVSGESYRYLGKQYRLKVIQDDSELVRLYRGKLEVKTKDPKNSKHIEKLVTNWFRSKAEIIFTERYQICTENVKQHKISHAQGFTLRTMPKRWGSCTKDNKILLNPTLIHASKDSIDYVITHELCHTLIKNHSKAFYDLLSKVMPDWKEQQYKLNNTIEVI